MQTHGLLVKKKKSEAFSYEDEKADQYNIYLECFNQHTWNALALDNSVPSKKDVNSQ